MSEINDLETSQLSSQAAAATLAKRQLKRTSPSVAKRKAEKVAKRPSSRSGSKGAKVLEVIARAKGATIAELMKATKWEAHSVRGYLSTVSKKLSTKIVAAKAGSGPESHVGF